MSKAEVIEHQYPFVSHGNASYRTYHRLELAQDNGLDMGRINLVWYLSNFTRKRKANNNKLKI